MVRLWSDMIFIPWWERSDMDNVHCLGRIWNWIFRLVLSMHKRVYIHMHACEPMVMIELVTKATVAVFSKSSHSLKVGFKHEYGRNFSNLKLAFAYAWKQRTFIRPGFSSVTLYKANNIDTSMYIQNFYHEIQCLGGLFTRRITIAFCNFYPCIFVKESLATNMAQFSISKKQISICLIMII